MFVVHLGSGVYSQALGVGQAMPKRTSSHSLPDDSSTKARWQVLSAQIEHLSKERRRAYRRRRKCEQRGLETALQRDTARALVARHNGSTNSAIAFLRFDSVSSGDLSRCERILKAWWDAAPPVERREAALEPRTKRQVAAHRKARQFEVEIDLQAWVGEQNMKKGITPRSSVVLRRLHSMEMHREPTAAPGGRTVKRKHQYQWLRRWRHRWHIRMAKLQVLKHLPPEEIRAKVWGAIGSAPERPPENVSMGGESRPKPNPGPANFGPRLAPARKVGGRKTVPF